MSEEHTYLVGDQCKLIYDGVIKLYKPQRLRLQSAAIKISHRPESAAGENFMDFEVFTMGKVFRNASKHR